MTWTEMLSSAPRFSEVLMKYAHASAGAIRVTTSASSCSMNSVCSPSEQRMTQSLFINEDLAKSTWTIGFWPSERVNTDRNSLDIASSCEIKPSLRCISTYV